MYSSLSFFVDFATIMISIIVIMTTTIIIHSYFFASFFLFVSSHLFQLGSFSSVSLIKVNINYEIYQIFNLTIEMIINFPGFNFVLKFNTWHVLTNSQLFQRHFLSCHAFSPSIFLFCKIFLENKSTFA